MRIVDRYAPALVGAMIALGSSSASATVLLLTQERSISAAASGFDPGGFVDSSDSDVAPGFDVFDSNVSASAPGGSSFASELSTVTSSLISAWVHTTASGDIFSMPYGGSGHAGSVFRISFSATEAIPYIIQGSFLMREAAVTGAAHAAEIDSVRAPVLPPRSAQFSPFW
ncbi:MAG TPA: hypothetical protein VMS55_25995 [Myxococcota bacterium]|nr:hypothetical protein [Myxococcota bacterium]